MFIDIVQLYAEAMYVATMHRPAPSPAHRMTPQPVREEQAEPTPFASPGFVRRMTRWVAHRLGLPGERVDVPATRQSRLQGCG
jgi:hypothetical protein